ncbi:dihydrofolate reductase family protein, partial [Streptomyces sp. NPDC097619]|uniref:dihydrofolate reductase family protein n=1 Tax=Streptomyces sp. NPDC097619 TaxID=3157228 RepID=UPI00331A8AD9
IAEGLVDELRLITMPVLLGGGKSIFPAEGGKPRGRRPCARTVGGRSGSGRGAAGARRGRTCLDFT